MRFHLRKGSWLPSSSALWRHIVSFVFLSAAISVSCLVMLSSKLTTVDSTASTNNRKLLFSGHSRPYPHIYAMPEYQSAAKYTPRFQPSRSYTEYNSYYGTGKRFWRKPVPLCEYDEEDKQSLKSTPTLAPDASQPTR